MSKITVSVVCALFIAAIIFIFSCAPSTLGILSSDDSFYYFLTARNIVLGNGVTFDGINITNGFHPLWMVTVIPIYQFTGGAFELSFRLIYLLELLLFAGSVFLGFKFLERTTSRIPALLSLLILINPLFFNLFFNGLESSLLMFLTLLLFNISLRFDLVSPQMKIGNQVLSGFLLGLIFLSRLDCAFHLIGLSIAAAIFFRIPIWNPLSIPSIVKSYGILFLIFLIVIAPYFAWNHITTGHLSPISGALKSSFPEPHFEVQNLRKLQWMPYISFIVVSVLFVLTRIVNLKNNLLSAFESKVGDKSKFVLIYGFWIGCVLHCGYTFFFVQWGTKAWHFASYIPLVLLCVALLLEKLIDLVKFKKTVIATVGLALFVSGIALLVLVIGEKRRHHSNWHDAAIWARNNTPEDSIFGMTDSGYFAYFSQRRTVNLDGLINGYEYQTVLKEGTLAEYFAECGLDYVNDYEVPDVGLGHHPVKLTCRLFPDEMKRKKKWYLLFPMDNYIYRSKPYAEYLRPESKVSYYIWKYDSVQIIPVL